jgi:hypothetical protein
MQGKTDQPEIASMSTIEDGPDSLPEDISDDVEGSFEVEAQGDQENQSKETANQQVDRTQVQVSGSGPK